MAVLKPHAFHALAASYVSSARRNNNAIGKSPALGSDSRALAQAAMSMLSDAQEATSALLAVNLNKHANDLINGAKMILSDIVDANTADESRRDTPFFPASE